MEGKSRSILQKQSKPLIKWAEMMFQPQLYGLKSVVTIYTVVNLVYKVGREGELLQVDSLQYREKPRFYPIYGIIPRRGL